MLLERPRFVFDVEAAVSSYRHIHIAQNKYNFILVLYIVVLMLLFCWCFVVDSGDSWDQFMAADLLQETLLWFDKRKINIGFQIWARHQVLYY